MVPETFFTLTLKCARKVAAHRFGWLAKGKCRREQHSVTGNGPAARTVACLRVVCLDRESMRVGHVEWIQGEGRMPPHSIVHEIGTSEQLADVGGGGEELLLQVQLGAETEYSYLRAWLAEGLSIPLDRIRLVLHAQREEWRSSTGSRFVTYRLPLRDADTPAAVQRAESAQRAISSDKVWTLELLVHGERDVRGLLLRMLRASGLLDLAAEVRREVRRRVLDELSGTKRRLECPPTDPPSDGEEGDEPEQLRVVVKNSNGRVITSYRIPPDMQRRKLKLAIARKYVEASLRHDGKILGDSDTARALGWEREINLELLHCTFAEGGAGERPAGHRDPTTCEPAPALTASEAHARWQGAHERAAQHASRDRMLGDRVVTCAECEQRREQLREREAAKRARRAQPMSDHAAGQQENALQHRIQQYRGGLERRFGGGRDGVRQGLENLLNIVVTEFGGTTFTLGVLTAMAARGDSAPTPGDAPGFDAEVQRVLTPRRVVNQCTPDPTRSAGGKCMECVHNGCNWAEGRFTLTLWSGRLTLTRDAGRGDERAGAGSWAGATWFVGMLAWFLAVAAGSFSWLSRAALNALLHALFGNIANEQRKARTVAVLGLLGVPERRAIWIYDQLVRDERHRDALVTIIEDAAEQGWDVNAQAYRLIAIAERAGLAVFETSGGKGVAGGAARGAPPGGRGAGGGAGGRARVTHKGTYQDEMMQMMRDMTQQFGGFRSEVAASLRQQGEALGSMGGRVEQVAARVTNMESAHAELRRQ
eukprot:gene6621-5830_t